MKKKVISMLLVAGLVSSLCACGVKEKKTEKQDEGVVTLKIAYKDDNASNEMAVKYYKELSDKLKEEGMNVELEVVDLPSEGYSDKLNLQLSSGDIPDIIYFQGGDSTFAEQGVLEDLTSYVENSTYLKEIMTEQNKTRLHNYPYLIWIKALTNSVPVVKKSVLEQVDGYEELLADPTVENYKMLLTGLVGKKDGSGAETKYGITTSGTTQELDCIFDMAFGNTKSWIKQADGSYIYKRVTDNERKKLSFYHELYKKGILDEEFITKKWDTKEQAFYDGDVAVILGTSGKVIDLYNEKVEQFSGDELVALVPAKGEEQGYGATDLSKESRGIAISSQSKHKDLAFQVLDFLASPKGQLLDRFGFSGEHYNMIDEQIEPTEEAANWYARFWEPRKLDMTLELTSEEAIIGKAIDATNMSAVAEDSLDKVEEFYEGDNTFVIPDELVTSWDAMGNIYSEFAVDVITGKKDIKEFDSFVKEWNEAGGIDVTQYANKQIKE